MADDIENLSEHETKLKEYWADVVKHIRRDLAYIWTDEVKRDFQSIKKESGQIALILQKLHRHYKIDKEIYSKEISDIRSLIHHLNRIEAKSDWVKIIYKDLLRVIYRYRKRKERKKSLSI